ncbi:MAG: flagellar biosynthesis protein FlhB [Lachnospiraceae bacterium]|nr:flagellar biosynthesis protein FlhB [Lachnospiraceae bacterium]
MLELNLQFFADGPGGEKTESATAKKLEDARKEGQVAKSKELGSAVMLIGLFLTLKVALSYIGKGFLEIFPMVYNKIPDYSTVAAGDTNAQAYGALISQILIKILLIALPFFAVGVLCSIVVDVAQVKWKPTGKPLKPKFSKLNPIKGFKKILSSRSLFELLKSIAKVVIISYLVYSTLKDKAGLIRLFYEIPLNAALAQIGDIVIDMGIKISLFYLILALADYAYEKFKFNKDMKMTKQEVKDEYKQSEGDPQIKSKIRQRMREASQRRMMQNLPEADVVITNPTHLAVAIKYDSELQKAPLVLAKGEDFLAQKIKEIAKQEKIEIVENKPLARMLYYNVDIDEEIPPELYQAVAEVLAFVYNKKNK